MAKTPKKTAEKLSAISVRIPPELLERLRKKTDETGVPISFVVRKALEEWVTKK